LELPNRPRTTDRQTESPRRSARGSIEANFADHDPTRGLRGQSPRRSRMEGAVALRVPLTVDVGVGENWKEAKS
jgi:hypothetical protein